MLTDAPTPSSELAEEGHVDFLVFSLLVKWLRTNQNFCYGNLIGSVTKYPLQPPQLTQLHWQKPQTGHIYTNKGRLLLGSFILFKEPVGVLSL